MFAELVLRCHPSPGPPHSTAIGSSNAMQSIQVEYFGQASVSELYLK